MKKIFRIASYDFKRLVFNPITLTVFIILLGACILLGSIIKIPTTPAYSSQISGQTASEIYTNFTSNSLSQDTKIKSDALLEDALFYIKMQTEGQCLHEDELNDINRRFQEIYNNLVWYQLYGYCEYTENDSISSIATASSFLNDFMAKFQNLAEFESNLIFTNAQFEKLEEINTDFRAEILKTGVTTEQHLDYFVSKISLFEEIDNITKSVFVWKADPELLTNLQTKYIETASNKTAEIYAEIEKITTTLVGDAEKQLSDIKSLITNYKLTCESGKRAVELQLRTALEKHFGDLKNIYNYEKHSMEEEKLQLIKIESLLADTNLYYTQYQEALNFYSASYEVSLFDNAYFVLSIIGFLTIIFGIFCAYKLFGRDRKTGKMDILLSQNVTFGQVFAGKFLAIVFTTTFFLAVFAAISLLWGSLFYPSLPGSILTVFNMSTAYTISPILFFFIKLLGIELQVIFYSVLTIFIMNLSRKFEINFMIALAIFALATVCNIFLNGSIIYCLFPFIHADLTSFLGGATMQTGFLKTALYSYGNFYISLAYYLVVVILFYSFTKQLFKKN